MSFKELVTRLFKNADRFICNDRRPINFFAEWSFLTRHAVWRIFMTSLEQRRNL
jgi:hypothetical protein